MNVGNLRALAVALAVIAPPAAAAAETYPARPVRIIVPFSPGGPADLLARIIGEKLHRSLGQPIVVLNKDGAGTILGVDMAAKAVPDGYTLLLGNVAMVINAASGKKLPYDMLKDLVPVTLAFTQPLVLTIHPAIPANSVKELIAHAKANPGKLRYGSSGVGTSIHLTTELFRTGAGIELTHVPYKGVAPAFTELLGGQIDMMFPGITPAMPHIKTGRVKTLAVTSSKRSPALPDVPTLAEAAIPKFESVGWYGVLVPAGTPKDIVSRLNAELARVLALPDVNERLVSQGGEPTSSTPDQLAALLRSELRKWTTVIKTANIRVE
jgi:tripartite-type tricarboxylate transporter receptor subunit TctC